MKTARKKADGINQPLELHKPFLQKILTGTIFLLAPAANHAWYKPIFCWLHATAACCFFGDNLGKKLDHYSLSRLTDGTPHSSSESLYFTLLLPFTWTKNSMSSSLSPACLFGPKLSKSNFSSLFSSVKSILSPTPISQNIFIINFILRLTANSFQFYKNILSPIFFLT